MVRPIVSDELVIPGLIIPKTPRPFSSGNLTAGRSVVGSFDAVPLYRCTWAGKLWKRVGFG
jgi:hypothetical protein